LIESIAYYLFGLALSAALTVAVGGPFAARRPRLVPALCAFALIFGLVVGWAINGYIAYVNLSAQRF
jgi:uncharacterized membrane protein